jgi:ankyrin repeat protein
MGAAAAVAAVAAVVGIDRAICEAANPDGGLAIAAARGDHAIVAALLKSGGTPNERHPYGWTALHAAAIRGDAKMCALLLEAGADPNTEDT